MSYYNTRVLSDLLSYEQANWYSAIAKRSRKKALFLLSLGALLLSFGLFFPILLLYAVDYGLAKPIRSTFFDLNGSVLVRIVFALLGGYVIYQGTQFYERAVSQSKLMDEVLGKIKNGY